MKSTLLVVQKSLVFLGMISSVSALAYVPAEGTSLLSAKSVARGGSTMASSNQGADGLLQNSASLAFEDQYAISFGLIGMGNTLSASIVDTKSGPLGGGLYYLRRDLRTQSPASLLMGNYSRLEERAGVSLFAKFSESFAMGLNAKYTYQKTAVQDIYSGRNFNGDLSFSVKASPEFSLAFTAQNVLDDKTGLDPKAYLFGAEYKPISNLLLSAQIVNVSSSDLTDGFAVPNPGELGFAGGASYRVNNFDIRSGYMTSGAWNRDLISAGFGYGDQKKFSIDYAFQYEQSSSNQFHGISVSGYL